MDFSDCPVPGTRLTDGSTVIASGWHTDNEYGVLLLTSATPFYRVAWIYRDTGTVNILSTHYNIVPAARDFDATFGFWGES